MNALSPVEIDRKVETLVSEKPLLHPEQQKVIDLLEEYPATHFHMWPFFTFEGGPSIGRDVYNTPVCFTCVAGWTSGVKSSSEAVAECARLRDIAELTSKRARRRMSDLIGNSDDVLTKRETIALVRDIFMDVGA